MLRLIQRALPAGLHRAAYRVAYKLRARWLRWRGGTVLGVTVIVHDDAARVLLVRHSYGRRHWTFPGGGRKRAEDPAETARREMAEEIGCTLLDLRHIGQTEQVFHTARNVMEVFTARAGSQVRIDGREIVAAQFFARTQLPPDAPRSVHRLLEMLDAEAG